MFLSEWREFPSAPCLAGKKKSWWQLASRCCWNRARPWHASKLVSFLVGLRTYQHPGTIRRMRIACWIPKATNTHSQYVILIAFPLQQWLHERDTMLRYAYLGCLVNLLAPELFFSILAHPVYKMWIKQEPNTLELWNKLHFEEKKTESIYHV